MFCYQCEQTSKGEGCQIIGVCGKDENTAALQDLLLHVLKGISMYAHRARLFGAASAEIDAFTIEALFATLTNVNFDADRVEALIHEAVTVRKQARRLYEESAAAANQPAEQLTGAAIWGPAASREGLLNQAAQHTIPSRMLSAGKEAANLEELVTYGIKGVAAYAAHAMNLGGADPEAYAVVHEALNALTEGRKEAELLALALKVGELNYRVMKLLDRAHTQTFGHPQPTTVRIHPLKGKAILISGHDLAYLYALLEQTAGLGINVYTHGEMLPAHGYPALKKFPHLAGPGCGICGVSRRNPDDVKLHSAAERELQGAHLYRRTCGMAGG